MNTETSTLDPALTNTDFIECFINMAQEFVPYWVKESSTREVFWPEEHGFDVLPRGGSGKITYRGVDIRFHTNVYNLEPGQKVRFCMGRDNRSPKLPYALNVYPTFGTSW